MNSLEEVHYVTVPRLRMTWGWICRPAEWPWGSVSHHQLTMSFSVKMIPVSIKRASIRGSTCHSWCFHSRISKHDDGTQLNTQDNHSSDNSDTLTSVIEKKKKKRKGQRLEAWGLLGSSTAGRQPTFIYVAVTKYPDQKQLRERKRLFHVTILDYSPPLWGNQDGRNLT